MKILIAYGSTEGHTRKIAHHINTMLSDSGHDAELFGCDSVGPRPQLDNYDFVLIAGSVHQEAHQRTVEEFVRENLEYLNSMPSAFVSVSLSASLKEGKADAEKYVSNFLRKTSWRPFKTHMAAGAIRFLEYDFFKQFTVEYMVLKGKKMPDKQAGNPEYTDWNALEVFVSGCIKSVEERQPA